MCNLLSFIKINELNFLHLLKHYFIRHQLFTINFVLTTYKILLCIYIWHFIAFTLSWKKITRGRPANKTIIFVPLSCTITSYQNGNNAKRKARSFLLQKHGNDDEYIQTSDKSARRLDRQERLLGSWSFHFDKSLFSNEQNAEHLNLSFLIIKEADWS